MGRYTGPVCRLCRREGAKLFLKGTRCYTEKCAVERRGYAPGVHGRSAGRRRKASEYALQLREKQKVKRIYGVFETQFANYFEDASRRSGVTGENLLANLETRLDNVVYRLGFAGSRKAARQLIRHRHIQVNERPVDIPSYRVQRGDVIKVRERARQLPVVMEGIERQGQESTVPWLEVDYRSATGRVIDMPTRADIPIAAQEQLIVELYSK
ncbi:MAG TPA: 30S ribosomal protein S4 [Gemmatimonadota bacterium]|jgi:small subunit ribosomal protein S4